MAIPARSNVVDKAAVIKRIQNLVPYGVPEPQEPAVLANLKTLTADLIQAYLAEGCLQEYPYAEALERRIHRYEPEIIKQLEGKVVLITGGEGCVGSYLLKELIELGVQRVVSVDKARCHESSQVKLIGDQKAFVVLYAADIRDYSALKRIFEVEKPDIVFHLAAQRQPGLAEIQIRETVTTNVFGTENVIQLCERYGVQQCIFSSTGKASRYFTSDVYAGSKKIAEWQFAQAAQKGSVKYGMVRFTHIVENSVVSQKIDQGIKRGLVKLHAPNLYIFAQNISEAVNLLLNAIVLGNSNKLYFLVVRNLGWVVDILELALFKIIQSKKNISLYFEGFLPGYNEPSFPGQVDPTSMTTEVNALINVIESSFSTFALSKDLVITELPPFSSSIFNTSLSALRSCTDDQGFPESKLKEVLNLAVKDVSRSIFLKAPPEQLLKILKLGVNPKVIELEAISTDAYRDVVEILVQGLYGRLRKEMFISAHLAPHDFNEIIDLLAELPSIHNEVAYLQAFYNNFSKAICRG